MVEKYLDQRLQEMFGMNSEEYLKLTCEEQNNLMENYRKKSKIKLKYTM